MSHITPAGAVCFPFVFVSLHFIKAFRLAVLNLIYFNYFFWFFKLKYRFIIRPCYLSSLSIDFNNSFFKEVIFFILVYLCRFFL